MPRYRLSDITKHLNFFRYHVILFTFVPIIFACIFYAGNEGSGGNANSTNTGRQKVGFVDSLFLCYSAMTVTGLVSVNLSALHPFQQALLFILFVCGDLTFVSYIMVLVRKRFFRTHCEELLHNNNLLKPSRTQTIFRRAMTMPHTTSRTRNPELHRTKTSGKLIGISGPTNGRVVDDYIDETAPRPDSPTALERAPTAPDPAPAPNRRPSESTTPGHSPDMGQANIRSALRQPSQDFPSHITISPPSAQYRNRQMLRERTRTMTMAQSTMQTSQTAPIVSYPPMYKPPATHIPTWETRMNEGYGGFSYPPYFLPHLIPKRFRKAILDRISTHREKSTLLMHPTIAPEGITQGGKFISPGQGINGNWATEDTFGGRVRARVAEWMPEGMEHLVIGRNSRFYTEELEASVIEQLGGVEFRALRMLSYLIPLYIVLIQFIPFIIIAIYLAKISEWNGDFQAQQGVQAGTVNKSWFSFFLTASAFSGCGMSLVDQSMVPFNRSYLLVYCLVFVIILGNHALPMTLRLLIWIATKFVKHGETNQTLHFLLDHPRRCYLYLFPSAQTWYLVFVFIVFMAIEILGYLVLDINLPVLSMSAWQRFSDSFFQSASVRATGFGIVSIANLAPAVLFLYVVLMYIAIYPIAMSVRSTNVYEERSLGVFNDDTDFKDDNEPAFAGRRSQVFGKYLWWHMRRQLAFDIWPLTLAIFVIACFERGKLLDPARSGYFTIFRIIFECTSAYSTIGLSMGTPNNNYSFAGELGVASKFVMILVMLRGRHRGLPLAIDRAIILPHEYERNAPAQNEAHDKTQQNGAPVSSA